MDQTHDVSSEKAVLACCLHSQLARGRARDLLSGGDFYEPLHEALWDAMNRLDRQDMTVDGPALLAVIGSGDRERAARLLPDLVTYPVMPESVDTHCSHVRQWAQKRRLWAETLRCQAEIVRDNVDIVGLAASTATRFAAIRDTGSSDEIESMTVEELMLEVDEEPDWVIPGFLERSDRFMLTGEEGLGKLACLNTPIATPTGWSTMGEIAVGDQVFAANGDATTVVAKSAPEFPEAGSWRMNFSDGTSAVVGGDHQWVTWDLKAREQWSKVKRAERDGVTFTPKVRQIPAMRTTLEIRDTLKVKGDAVINHAVLVAGALDLSAADLPIDPYLFGVWLGDGTSSTGEVTVAHRDWVISENLGEVTVRRDKDSCSRVRVVGLTARLRALGVLNNKHIPMAYLRGSVEQRKALLAGLCDTDGYCPDSSGEGRGTGWAGVEVTFTNEALARGTFELAASLGVIPKMYEGRASIDGVDKGPKWRVYFAAPFNPFRHAEFKAERWAPLRTARSSFRYIQSVERVPDTLMQCIQVAHESGTYLIEKEMIPTHNSHLLRQIVILAHAGLNPFRPNERIAPVRGMVIDFENSRRQVRRRLQQTYLYAQRGLGSPGEAAILAMPRSDITSDRILSKIHRELDHRQPDILVIGPLYRMSPKAMNDDTDATPVLAALDTIRDRGIAVLIEAHAGHTMGAGRTRDLRPRGSSQFMGWPEFGYGMKATADGSAVLVPWRGDRDLRDFPTGLHQVGGLWQEQRANNVAEFWRPKEDWSSLAEGE